MKLNSGEYCNVTSGNELTPSLTGISACATQAETGAAVGAAMGGGTISVGGGAMVGFGAGRAYDERQNR